MSDHTPLLLQGDIAHRPNSLFHFDNFWVPMEGFKEAVQEAWNRPLTSTQHPFKRLRIKLARRAKSIKAWWKSKVGGTRLQLAIVKEVILRLETTQDDRVLFPGELDLLKKLKISATGLAVIEKSRIRHRALLL